MVEQIAPIILAVAALLGAIGGLITTIVMLKRQNTTRDAYHQEMMDAVSGRQPEQETKTN